MHWKRAVPYAYFSDVVVGETTCDGKKKMYELLGELKPMQVIHLPNLPDYDRSLEMWTMELRTFAKGLAEKFDVEITEEKLNAAIKWCNKERKQAARIYELGRYDPPAIQGCGCGILWKASSICSIKKRNIREWMKS